MGTPTALGFGFGFGFGLGMGPPTALGFGFGFGLGMGPPTARRVSSFILDTERSAASARAAASSLSW